MTAARTHCPCGKAASRLSTLCKTCAKAKKTARERIYKRKKRLELAAAGKPAKYARVEPYASPKRYVPGKMNPNRPFIPMGRELPIGEFVNPGVPVRRLEPIMPTDVRAAWNQDPRSDAEMAAWRRRNA